MHRDRLDVGRIVRGKTARPVAVEVPERDVQRFAHRAAQPEIVGRIVDVAAAGGRVRMTADRLVDVAVLIRKVQRPEDRLRDLAAELRDAADARARIIPTGREGRLRDEIDRRNVIRAAAVRRGLRYRGFRGGFAAAAGRARRRCRTGGRRAVRLRPGWRSRRRRRNRGRRDGIRRGRRRRRGPGEGWSAAHDEHGKDDGGSEASRRMDKNRLHGVTPCMKIISHCGPESKRFPVGVSMSADRLLCRPGSIVARRCSHDTRTDTSVERPSGERRRRSRAGGDAAGLRAAAKAFTMCDLSRKLPQERRSNRKTFTYRRGAFVRSRGASAHLPATVFARGASPCFGQSDVARTLVRRSHP